MLQDAEKIIKAALNRVMPGEAVRNALSGLAFGDGRLIAVAAGKAAWEMGYAAAEFLGSRIDRGIVITKYEHSKGEIPGFEICEAGHPVPDENSYAATQRALDLVKGLSAEDSVLFLLSGGGSALFEKPLVGADEMASVTKQLLACGADIVEINTIRKRLSAVKGGRFAQCCAPAHVYTVVLSDIIGDPLDMIASGPAYPDSSTAKQAVAVCGKYQLMLSEKAQALVREETPKSLENVTTFVNGSVRELAAAAAEKCEELGYEPVILTARMTCEARKAGEMLASIARMYQNSEKSIAFLAGGETIVHLTGSGLGGRNQEIALAAAARIGGCRDTCIFSFGSDGTDGPTDAAGGIVTGDTEAKLSAAGLSIPAVLADNDAYHALKAVDALVMTGPTGTNVNDLSVVLIKRS